MPADLVIRTLDCPNFGERRRGHPLEYLILHYTGTEDGLDAESHYMNPKPDHAGGPVSPHYMIDTDGSVTSFVPEEKRAWHAGLARFDGMDDMNSRSIGIEIVNPGHELGYRVFPAQQMGPLIRLSRQILARHNIPAANVLGHSDIAPFRKKDPGELFDWKMLAMSGIGLWPEPDATDMEMADALLADETKVRRALIDSGYDDQMDTATLIMAFQRHFQPEAFRYMGDEIGTVDRTTAARLNWLRRTRGREPNLRA